VISLQTPNSVGHKRIWQQAGLGLAKRRNAGGLVPGQIADITQYRSWTAPRSSV